MSSLLFLLGPFCVGYLLNLVFVRFSKKMGALSVGNRTEVRWASRAKPLVGGQVLFVMFLLSVAALLTLAPMLGLEPQLPSEFGALLFASSLGFFVGLCDDAYNTAPRPKFLGQVACGVLMIAMGVEIRLFGTPWLDWPLTVLWVVGIMNSFNMMDNMDGVSGTFSVLVLTAALPCILWLDGAGSLFWYLTLALIGAHIGFLVLNYNPSKLYMGDTGSMFLGVLLAYFGIRYFWNLPDYAGQLVFSRQLLLPLLAFSMTIMDTSFVTFARIARKQSPFVGGRDHISHHLVYAGLPDKLVPVVTGSVTVVSAIIVLSMVRLQQDWSWGLTGLCLAYLAVLVSGFAYIYRYGAARQRAKAVVNEATPIAMPVSQPVPAVLEKALA
jgi:UDP-GlcNAc:undecaprenyl-phosphate/decaprenyl-phosphate GlcNAc-1-phosphate transferase